VELRGFVDLQVNGYRQVDFSDPELSADAVVAAWRGLIADGTAQFLPTLITADERTYARNLPLISKLAAQPEFAPHILGFHLEGPFLCPQPGAAGAHAAQWMQPADPALLVRLQQYAAGRIRLLTVAADLPEVAPLIIQARKLGIVVSLGHHLANSAQLAAAAAAGASALTHLGNGLPQQIDRHRNPLFAGMAADELQAMVIGDGHHLPWELLRLILRSKGADRTILVSDASPLAGMPPGDYPCFGATARLEADGRLANPATGYLMGSSLTLRQVVNASRHALHLDDATCTALAVTNPLRLLGIVRHPLSLPRAADGSFLPFR
jgi:N-acetylglucosamine-6-phosphate deacetylase